MPRNPWRIVNGWALVLVVLATLCATNEGRGQTGACCYSDGTCALQKTFHQCHWEEGGTYLGDGSTCNGGSCPFGACCYRNTAGVYVCDPNMLEITCLAKDGGLWEGLGTTTCQACPHTGACCLSPDGCFTGVPQANCELPSVGGIWQGADTTSCTICPPYGACCFGDGCNPAKTEVQCLAEGGTWQDPAYGKTCADCPGACCHPAGSCTPDSTEAACSDTWLRAEVCDPNPCPQPTGACCVHDSTETYYVCHQGMTEAECTDPSLGGAWQGKDSITCQDCPPTGACCLSSESCADNMSKLNCIAPGGLWQGEGSSCPSGDCPDAQEICDGPKTPYGCVGGPDPQGPAVKPQGQCTNDNPAPSESKCWFSNMLVDGEPHSFWPLSGFPLNINLWQAFGPADYPPLKTDPVASSSPLVSREVQHFAGPVPYRERVALNDIMDLATGSPLLQAVDFELPFGGATFRHVRTYSENYTMFYLRQQWWSWGGGQAAEGTFWDWNGLFWMMGENPILLIDMQFADHTDHPIPDSGPRCYLIPDAHHAIPFLWETGTNNYTAPPWFDAILSHNGTKDQSTGGWQTPPTEFYVYLQRRTIKYTFEAHFEDLWEENVYDPNDGLLHSVNVHQPRSLGGHGLPYYGIVKEISDRYGNKVCYDYCGFHQRDCDDQKSPADITSSPTECCKECCQNCNEKGQIKRIQLKTHSGDVAWTLLYTHRSFDFTNPQDEPDDPPWGQYKQHALHSIHVYKGDVSVGDSCLTLDPNSFCIQSGPDPSAHEQITHPAILDLESQTNGPRWVIEARYLYHEAGAVDPSAPDIHCQPNVAYGKALNVSDDYPYAPSSGHLLKVMVTRRNADGAASDKQVTMYRYAPTCCSPLDAANGYYYLQSIYGNDTIQGLVKARQDKRGTPGISPNFLFDIPTYPHDPGSLDPNELVDYFDSKTGTLASKPLGDVADVVLSHTTNYDRNCDEMMIQQYIGSTECLTERFVLRGTYLRDHRAGSPDNGTYHLYYYVQYPEHPQPNDWPRDPCGSADTWGFPQDTIFHHPFKTYFPWYRGDGGDGCHCLYDLPSDKPFFTVVIDKESEAKGAPSYYGGGSSGAPTGLDSRRIVEMNPTGFTVRDRRWQSIDGALQQTQQTGQGELCKYDTDGRLVEVRSRGWDSKANEGQTETNGLIHFFEYYTGGDAKGELKAEGIKKGAAPSPDNPKYYTHTYARGYPGRPELVTKEAVFATPTQTVDPENPTGGAVTTTEYHLQTDSDPTTPIRSKLVTGPGALWTTPTIDPNQYNPIQWSVCDDNGNTVWVAVGSRVGATGPIKEMFLNYVEYNDEGQPTLQIVDADPTSPPAAGWQRVASTPALKLTTRYEYDPVYGLVHTILPNGRENRVVYAQNADGTSLTQWIFNDVVLTGSSWKALSPVRVRTIQAGKLSEEKQVRLLSTPGAEPGAQPDSNLEVLSSTKMSYDENGRPAGVQRQDAAGATQLQGSVGYNANGEMASQVGPDGTITRHVYDELGRLRSTYRGTNDIHEFWGTGVLCVGDQTPATDGCYDPDTVPFPDNMVLIEKRYYGDGRTDVNSTDQLIQIRTYRDKPQNQYPFIDSDHPENSLYSNEDSVGWTTNIQYDWHMRPVWEERCAADSEGQGGTVVPGASLTHKVTWYDNLDRVRFEAEYGATPPDLGSVDPRYASPGAEDPNNPVPILATSPISLTETRYNARGQAEEVRHYNVAETNGSAYTATVTYYNHADKPVEVHSPNAPVQKYVYDAKGRQIRSSSFAGAVEITRTETAYDLNDRAYATTYWERKPNATGGDPLDDGPNGNSIKSYTQTWYDKAGKVIATANYGTNHGTTPETDIFVTGGAPAYDPDSPPVEVDTQTGAVTRCAYEQFVTLCPLVTCYDYDKAGNQSAVFHPDGTVTRSEYDDLGRLVLTTENADDPDPALHQLTSYVYDGSGRLIQIKAILPANGQQVTEIKYETEDGQGAAVVNSAGVQISGNNAFIKEVRFPDRANGDPNPNDAIKFTYYSDGSVATRTDQRGIVFSHHYDELGRRIQTVINDDVWYGTPPGGSGQTMPADRLHRLDYVYKTDGPLERVTAYPTLGGGAEGIVADNLFQYDERGNLLADYQQHYGALVPEATPRTGYAWDYSPMSDGNYDRLWSISYPQHFGSASRAVHFNYDGGGGIDSALNRISAITHTDIDGAVAAYQYAGSSRRAGMQYGTGVPPLDPVISQSFADGNGTCFGLDRFGRVKDLHFKIGTDTFHRYQYGYDSAGNRLYARVQQATFGEEQHVNDRSYRYYYDTLNRLVDAQMGQLDSSNETIITGGGSPSRTTQWSLDNLGNWSGGNEQDGSVIRAIDSDGDGSAEQWEYIHHQVDSANQIGALYDFDPLNPVPPTPIVHDPAGNLACDGTYYYQFDAWNRLVQVNAIGTAVLGTDGRVASGDLGDWVCRYIYDGLGRLIRKETPVATASAHAQTKDYYYDGVRRIQEVIVRPEELLSEPPPLGGGIQNDELPMLLDGGGLLDPNDEDPEPIPPPVHYQRWIDREYVYGPAYVDEFVCQIDRYGGIIYMVQDANYNVVALVSGGCCLSVPPGNCVQPPAGTILEQYTYEPYGGIVAEELFFDHAVNRVGFQGLFFERFDGSFTDLTITSANEGLYHARNRFYSPTLGRFIQRDVNETALPIITALAMNGRAMSILLSGFSAQGLYGDGTNLYRFGRSNPVNRRDPSGRQPAYEWAEEEGPSLIEWGASVIENFWGLVTACSFQLFVWIDQAAACLGTWGSSIDPSVSSSAMQETYDYIRNASGGNEGKQKALQQHIQNTSNNLGGPEDPLDQVPYHEIVKHGDPSKWRPLGPKPGFPTVANDGISTKCIENWIDEFGEEFEAHYIRLTDGRVIDWKSCPPSP